MAEPRFLTYGEYLQHEGNLPHSASVTLTNDEIIFLPTTPFVLIPATETLNFSGFPTQLPKVLSGYVILDATAGNYETINDGRIQLLYGSDGQGAIIGQTYRVTSIDPFWNPTGIVAEAKKSIWSFAIAESDADTDTFSDNGISLSCANGEDFTGGNAANSMTVVLNYVIIDGS